MGQADREDDGISEVTSSGQILREQRTVEVCVCVCVYTMLSGLQSFM